jgi:hypothetical protein
VSGASSPRYWRVVFTETGALESVTEVEGPDHAGWVIVEARSEEAARRKAYNIYCGRKKKLAKQRHHAAGQCVCGREQNRKHPSGKWMLTCSTCAERQKVYNDRTAERDRKGIPAGSVVRDEGARVAANLNRQRDRRGEIRLETLIEVRAAWQRVPNIGAFSAWMKQEIDLLTGAESRRESAA